MSFKANPFTQYICASVTVQKRIGPKGKTDAEVEDSMTIPLSLSTLILKTSTVLLSFLQQILIFRLHLHDLVICARRLHAQDECKLTWVSMAQLLICQSVKVKIKIQINYYKKNILFPLLKYIHVAGFHRFLIILAHRLLTLFADLWQVENSLPILLNVLMAKDVVDPLVVSQAAPDAAIILCRVDKGGNESESFLAIIHVMIHQQFFFANFTK